MIAPGASTTLFLPGLAMVALTFVVLGVMFRRRVAQMRRDRIRPQQVATSQQAAALYADVAPADNFRNLFEMPVLFYFALTVAAISGQTGPLVVGLAWAYVAARIAHSVIQCTYNRVMHRFRAFAASVFVLLALWSVLGYGLVAG
ncbi:MAG: MAPEG family protein [Xanthomonadales bacterium]|nr:MAPEG family protein [Xanthomonadales bacterium]